MKVTAGPEYVEDTAQGREERSERTPGSGSAGRAVKGAGPLGAAGEEPRKSRAEGGAGKIRGGEPRGPRPARANSPLAAGPASLRPLFATLAAGLRAPVDAGICPRQVTLQVFGLGERRSCRHGSGEGRETDRR